jgi:putative peptidoglycan lipid II flippase
VPFAVFQLLLRVFYSFGDTRTPVFVGAGTTAVNALLMVLFYNLLPASYTVMGLALAYAIAFGLGAIAAWSLASRRLQGLGGWTIGMALTRMYFAALPTAVLALVTVWMITGIFGGLDLPTSLIVLAVGGGLGLLLYLGVAHRMRIPEVNSLVGMVAGRVGR